jgi:hypothetical protein
MVVIRRERPRTKIAGQVVKAYRIRNHKASPMPCAIPAADHLCLYRVHGLSVGAVSGRALELLGARTVGAFEFNADRPDEAQQLAATAVMIFCLVLPRASNARQLWCGRCYARQAMALTASLCARWRTASPAPMAGRCWYA